MGCELEAMHSVEKILEQRFAVSLKSEFQGCRDLIAYMAMKHEVSDMSPSNGANGAFVINVWDHVVVEPANPKVVSTGYRDYHRTRLQP